MTKIEHILNQRKKRGENKNAYYGAVAGRANTSAGRIIRFSTGKQRDALDIMTIMLEVANEMLQTKFKHVGELFEEVK